MKQKVMKVLNKVYAILMSLSFFAGILPIIPFIVAIIIGGDAGAAISNFLYKQYYVWVIACGSVAVIVGCVAMYIGKIESLSLKSIAVKTDEEDEKTETKKEEKAE